MPEPLAILGSAAGLAGLTFATFVTVSYLEVKDKINQQIIAGEDPYELKVETKPRKKPAQKKSGKAKRK